MWSQFEANILKLLGIPGQILVQPMTQIFRSKWLRFLVRRDRMHSVIYCVHSFHLLNFIYNILFIFLVMHC